MIQITQIWVTTLPLKLLPTTATTTTTKMTHFIIVIVPYKWFKDLKSYKSSCDALNCQNQKLNPKAYFLPVQPEIRAVRQIRTMQHRFFLSVCLLSSNRGSRKPEGLWEAIQQKASWHRKWEMMQSWLKSSSVWNIHWSIRNCLRDQQQL